MLFLMTMCWLGSGFEEQKTYAAIPEDFSFLSTPYSALITPGGELLVADSKASRIYVWQGDGAFRTEFAEEGEGPGELFLPLKLDVAHDQVWVWDYRGRLSAYDLNGEFKRSLVAADNRRPRTFAVLSPDLILVGYKQMGGPDEIYAVFDLVDGNGKLVKNLKKIKDESYLSPRKDDNRVLTKAWAPEIDIQRAGDNRWLFGFSQTNTLYEVDQTGTITGQTNFQIPARKATDEEAEKFRNLSMPSIQGQVVELNKLPNLRLSFADPMAYYTQFGVKDDKVLFLLTPLGGMASVGNGFHEGLWFLCDRKSGALIKRGKYSYPEGSVVFLRHDRLIGALLDDQGDFRMVDLAFPR